jgi:transcriptional regulator with AAA-type ATPase domain
MLEQPATDRQWIHAAAVSELLGLDRANVARELNTLYRDGDLIKLQGKPTLYICREALNQQYPGVFFPSTLPKGSRVEDYTTSQAA